MLQLRSISGGYQEQIIVKQVSATFEKGKFYGILGPNGSGKSTLLKLMSGILKPTDGEILLDEKPLTQYLPKKLAQKLAVLPQLNASSFSNTVWETVALGRYPHQSGFFSSWSEADEAAVLEAMTDTGVANFAHSSLPFLSGGEQQRVFIAQTFAQQPELLLLDEPTNHLDIAHQRQTLDLVRKKVSSKGIAAVAVFHDINLASIYCDELILMKNGEIQYQGEPHEVIRASAVQHIYGTNVATYAHPQIPKPQITLLPAKQQDVEMQIVPNDIKLTKDFVHLQVKSPLKVISSAVYNAGVGWYQNFINRTVAGNYSIENTQQEVEQFLQENCFTPTNSVVMLTAVPTHCVVVEKYEKDELSIVVAVTAGTGNAVDASKAYLRNEQRAPGTINTWVFINGFLTDEAFFQAMITATEAKVKALQQHQIFDKVSNTTATGTGTDSLLIATTQIGSPLQYAGPLTNVGQLIGYGVCDATCKAIKKYQQFLKEK